MIFLINISGCSSHDFSVKNLAKSDFNEVADYHYKEIKILLKDLTLKLYKRNPKYLKDLSNYANLTDSINYKLKQIFDRPMKTDIPEVAAYGTDAIELSLNSDFEGDRVLAFMGGLTDMIRKAYGHNEEFFVYEHMKIQSVFDHMNRKKVHLALVKDENGLDQFLIESSIKDFILYYGKSLMKLVYHYYFI